MGNENKPIPSFVCRISGNNWDLRLSVSVDCSQMQQTLEGAGGREADDISEQTVGVDAVMATVSVVEPVSVEEPVGEPGEAKDPGKVEEEEEEEKERIRALVADSLPRLAELLETYEPGWSQSSVLTVDQLSGGLWQLGVELSDSQLEPLLSQLGAMQPGDQFRFAALQSALAPPAPLIPTAQAPKGVNDGRGGRKPPLVYLRPQPAWLRKAIAAAEVSEAASAGRGDSTVWQEHSPRARPSPRDRQRRGRGSGTAEEGCGSVSQCSVASLIVSGGSSAICQPGQTTSLPTALRSTPRLAKPAGGSEVEPFRRISKQEPIHLPALKSARVTQLSAYLNLSPRVVPRVVTQWDPSQAGSTTRWERSRLVDPSQADETQRNLQVHRIGDPNSPPSMLPHQPTTPLGPAQPSAYVPAPNPHLPHSPHSA